jgi:hypothetical protein
MSGAPAPDDRHRGNGHREPGRAGQAGCDPVDAWRARLAGLWTVALQRFRDYAHRSTSGRAARPARHDEENR